MHTYLIHFDDDSTIHVEAPNIREALTVAESLCPRSQAVRAERLD